MGLCHKRECFPGSSIVKRFGQVALAVLLFASPPGYAGIQVDVAGINGAPRANVLTQLEIVEQADKKNLTQAEVDDLNKRAPAEIKVALQPFGYYHPRIQSRLTGAAPNWKVRYTVSLGPPAIIRALKISVVGAGKDINAIKAILANPGMAVGQRLNQPNWTDLKKDLFDAAYEHGYLDAQFTQHQIRVNLQDNTADLTLTLDTGVRYYVGPITIHHSPRISGDFLRRYLKIHSDDPFLPNQLLATQFALSDLGYFSSVNISPEKSKAVHYHVPVDITTKDAPQRRYRYGIGYGTDTGARALWSLDIRRLGREGHKLDTDVRLAQKISAVISEYRIPFGHNPGDYYGFTIEGLTQQLYNGKQTTWALGTSYNTNGGAWQKKLYLRFSHDSFGFTNAPGTSSHLLTPGFSFTYRDEDKPVLPNFGWSVFTDVHGALKQLISSATFIQGHVILKGVVTPTPGLRLLGRAEYGGTLVQGFARLPASERFFAGGIGSVRGYPYQSLGPRDAQGNVIGGRYLQTYSIEADYKFLPNWGVAVFSDAGGAGNTPSIRLHESVGVGALYYLPFGAAALYLSHPLDQGTSPVVVDIGIKVGL